MKHEALSRKIIGAAQTVLYALKPGLDEKLYEHALVLELGERGMQVVNSCSISNLCISCHPWSKKSCVLIVQESNMVASNKRGAFAWWVTYKR